MLGQQRGVHVHRAAGGDVQHLLGEDLPEGGGDHHVRREGLQLRNPLRGLELFKLIHRQSPRLRPLLDRAGGQLFAPSRGAVGLGEYAHHVVARVAQRLQRRHRKFRGAHEDHAGHWPSPPFLRFISSVASSIILST